MRKANRVLRIAVSVALLGVSFAQNIEANSQPPSSNRFYDRKAEGWFWYETEPEEIELVEEEPTPPPVVVAVEPEPEPEEETILAEPAPSTILSASWLKENLPKYRLLAIDNPSMENVRVYLYLQRQAMDMAERYATATEMATQGDPFLDETIRRPLAGYAVDSVDAASGLAKNELLQSLATQVGIFYFFASTCTMCELQAPLLKSLSEHEGFALVPVSLDGKNLITNPFDTFEIDQGHAEMLQVQNLPATYLVTPAGSFAPIGQGVYSLPELQQRILVAARRENIISQAEFNQTRPIVNYNNLADLIAPNGTNENQLHEFAIDETGFVAPEHILEYLTEKMGNHR